MARAIHTRLILQGTLTAQAPLHIGGAEEGIEVDMPVALNGNGDPYAPGTSLTGAIRAWIESAFDPWLVRCWFGFQEIGTDRGAASRLVVEDAPISLPTGAPPEVWHGVGIDRQWGSAAAEFKFERQILPKGSTLTLRLHLDVADEEGLDDARAALWQLGQALHDGHIGLGAANTRGLGCVTLNDDWNAWEHDWSSKKGVLGFLRNRSGGTDCKEVWRKAADARQIESDAITLTIDWSPNGPLMVKAPRDGMAVDTLPMLSADGTKQTMVLPGSSIKGVLRTQAERIVRTLCGHEFQWKDDDRGRFLDQLTVPLVMEVFGSARPPKEAGSKVKGMRGALHVGNSYATSTRMTRDTWRKITDARGLGDGEKSPLPEVFTEHGLKFHHAYHVAVDRWTGGAADKLLFSGIEPMGVAWEPLQLRLQLAPLRKRGVVPGVAFALLWLVLRDLAEGGLGLGFGNNRGYGNVSLHGITVTGLDRIAPDDAEFPPEARIPIADGKPDPSQVLAALNRFAPQWAAWIEGLTDCTRLTPPAAANPTEAT